MPFTMPNFDMPSQPELGNPLSASISGLLAGVNGAPKFKKEMAEAKYAPLTLQAKAMSEMAYANLMGPQFIAKLMANPSFWHSLPDETKDILNSIAINAGTGQTNAANNLLNPNSITAAMKKNNSNSNQQQNDQPNTMPQNPPPNYSPPDQSNTNPMKPDDESTQPPISQFRSGASADLTVGAQTTPTNLSSYDQYGNNVKGTQQDIDNAIKHGQQTLNSPQTAQTPDVIEVDPVTQKPIETTEQSPKKTYAEREAEYENIVAEGKELGGARGKAIGELGTDIKGIKEESGLLGQISSLLKSPVIQSVRQSPVGGNLELSYYKINGSKEQKDAIGAIGTLNSELATQMTQRYKGSFKPTGELPLINQAKVNLDKDTLDAAMGKMTSLITLNQMDDKRDHIAYELMHGSKHMDEVAAYEEADKQVHGDEIRANVRKAIFPKPTELDIQHMMEKYKKYNISRQDVINKLKTKGYDTSGL